MKKKNILFLLCLLIIIGAILRFYNLNWGAPFYFHPDERNIASAVSGLKFPDQLNPHFFAYGSLPIYTIYLTGVFVNYLSLPLSFQLSADDMTIFTVSFELAILISRFFSALFSLLLIPLMFFIGKKIYLSANKSPQPPLLKGVPKAGDLSNQTGLIAAFFATFSTGLIQYAHFGTFEMWLTLLSVLLFLFTLRLLRRLDFLPLLVTALVFGAAIATKVSHIALLPLPVLALFLSHFYPINKEHRVRRIFNFIRNCILFCAVSILVFFITNPFVYFDFSEFYGSMFYESRVALGTLSVFYTGEFKNVVPVVFQFLHIYPFLLNPLLTCLFIPSFFYLIFISIKTKNSKYLMLNIFFLILFLSQAFLYAKWIRYMVPTLPFMYLIMSLSLSEFIAMSKSPVLRTPPLFKGVGGIFVCITIIFSISYFITAYIQTDTRIAAKIYALQHVPSNAAILSEVFDMGITPFNDSFPNITLFNFYDLDNNSPEYTTDRLAQQLAVSDYIILPSQRILKTRLNDPITYPLAYSFYSALFAHMNGFQKIYATPCDIFCRITYLNSPVFSFEETANVFDRPVVYIYEKIKN